MRPMPIGRRSDTIDFHRRGQRPAEVGVPDPGDVNSRRRHAFRSHPHDVLAAHPAEHRQHLARRQPLLPCTTIRSIWSDAARRQDRAAAIHQQHADDRGDAGPSRTASARQLRRGRASRGLRRARGESVCRPERRPGSRASFRACRRAADLVSRLINCRERVPIEPAPSVMTTSPGRGNARERGRDVADRFGTTSTGPLALCRTAAASASSVTPGIGSSPAA